jgi:hypothetical protein
VYVTVTSVRTADQPLENATIVAEEMVQWLRDIDGFEGFLMLSQEGRTIGLSFWETRAVADRHRAARMQFIERMSAVVGVEIEQVDAFQVSFAELGPRLAAFSG